MRSHRFFLSLGLLLLALLPVKIAQADDGPHGGYTPTTAECATCHLAHSGDGPHLLNTPDQDNAFCFTCHNGTGATAVPITSTHSNIDYAGGAESAFTLLCIQCHSPHGSKNLALIKEEVLVQTGLPAILSGPVIFNARTGIDSFDDGVSNPASRICTTCHSNSANSGFPMTYHIGGENHLGGLDLSGQNCVSCHPHSADDDQGTLDGFMAVGGGCVGCHSVPQDNGDRLPVDGRRPVINDFENTSHHVQGDVSDDDCLVCHSVALHASGYVRLVDADDPAAIVLLNCRPDTDPAAALALEPFCLACHDSNGAGGFAPFHNGIMPASINQTMWNNASHGINSTCYDCHSNGHGSVKDHLLSPWDAIPDGALPGDMMREEEGLCYTCHDGNGLALSNIRAEFGRNSHHNVSALDQVDGSKIECLNCHNPHTVNAASPLSNPENQAALWTGDDTDFCLTCHDGNPPIGVKFPTATGTDFNKSTYSGSTHAIPLGEYGCRHCHEQHGSGFASLLSGQYATADYTPYSADSYQLCWTCHDENGTIWQINRFRNQHSRHVNQANSPCILCHDVHAPQDAHELGLINFDYSVLNGYDILYLAGYEGSTSFTIELSRNRGSCSIACHSRTHTERFYVRGPAIPTDCIACHPGGMPVIAPFDSIFPIPFETIESSMTPTPTGTPETTATAVITGTITVSPTVFVTPTPTSMASPTETAVTPSFTPTSSPTSTATITPSATPTLTSTPTPSPTNSPTRGNGGPPNPQGL